MSEQGGGGREQTNKQSCRSEDWEVCYGVCVCVCVCVCVSKVLKYKEKYASTVFGSVKYTI
jgi:hypothetical protein